MESLPAAVAVLIPIAVVMCVFAMIIVAIIVEGKGKELEHKERLLAIEKGIELPEPKTKKKPGYMTIRVWGFVTMCVGMGFVIAMWVTLGVVGGVWGLLPIGIGIGLLVAAYLDRKESIE